MAGKKEIIRYYRNRIYTLGQHINHVTRVAIKFMLMCGLSYKEIAKELDISEECAFALDHRTL